VARPARRGRQWTKNESAQPRERQIDRVGAGIYQKIDMLGAVMDRVKPPQKNKIGASRTGNIALSGLPGTVQQRHRCDADHPDAAARARMTEGERVMLR
jgi:hypothetical protein